MMTTTTAQLRDLLDVIETWEPHPASTPTEAYSVLRATSPFHPFFLPAAGLYAAASLIEGLRVAKAEGLLHLAPVVASIFPVLHVSHGLGFGVGLVTYVLKPDWEKSADPTAAKKSFADAPAVVNGVAHAGAAA